LILLQAICYHDVVLQGERPSGYNGFGHQVVIIGGKVTVLNPELQRRVEELAGELTKLRDSL
jgi:hypothetical protein